MQKITKESSKNLGEFSAVKQTTDDDKSLASLISEDDETGILGTNNET